jgi:hypothetical protein
VSHDDKSLFVHDFPHISESLSFLYKTFDPIRNILLENSAVPFSCATIHPEAVEIELLKLKDNSSVLVSQYWYWYPSICIQTLL